MADSDKNQPDSSKAPQEITLDIESREQLSALQFVQTDENPGDLTVILPDDTPDNPDDNPRIVLPNYIALAGAGLPPALTLADGTVIPGEEILNLIEGLDYGKVAPAAGQQGGQNSAGGGAGFAAYTTEELGDDLNHGPYGGGYLGPRVELGDQDPVLPDDGDGSGGGGGGGGGGTPSRFTGSGAAIYENNDADRLWRMHTDPDPTAPASPFIRELFATVHTIGGLATENGGDNSGIEHLGGGYGQVAFWANLGVGFDDWDGGRIWLQAGETITLTNQTPGGIYWLGISDDHDAETVTPPGQPSGELEWDLVTRTGDAGDPGSLSYTATADGWHYFGVGSEPGITLNNPGATYHSHDYQTLITISPPGATSNVIPGTSGGDTLVGTAGDDLITSGDGADTLTGAGGDDVLVGGAGDDTLTGSGGADTFMFNGSAEVGHDHITDFDTAEGDIINLDALFDSLGVASTDRVVDAQISGADTVLQVGTESGGVFTDATGGTFSVTVEGTGLTATDINNLIASGNIVVDES